MNVKKIELQNYRNIETAVFEPSTELTIICGKNGQGKTNLLESIWLLTGSKSFRGAKDSELIQEKKDFSVIESWIETQAYEKKIRLVIGGENSEKKGRNASVNEVAFGRAYHLAGVFSAVVFDPGHLSLVKGSPEGRRKFIDAALCQLYPHYLPLYRRYMRLVTQKNALLKQYHQLQNAKELLDVFDADLALYGMQLSEKRKQYFAMIQPEIVKIYADISSHSERLETYYESSYNDNNLQEVIAKSRARDLAAGFCTTGPHKEDFSLRIDGRDAKTYASQGQQRSAVLSIKLAEAAGVNTITGQQPVMLLDDVLSELDHTRQDYLLNRIKHTQTIVTACDEKLFCKTKGLIYTMTDGVLQETSV